MSDVLDTARHVIASHSPDDQIPFGSASITAEPSPIARTLRRPT